MNKEEQEKEILREYMPESAVDFVYDFVKTNGVTLRFTNSRSSKLGDYRAPSPTNPRHVITINHDLHPYLKLLVFLHEAAHLFTHMTYGRQVQPHGHQWQKAYAKLMQEHCDLFPDDVRPKVMTYASRIPLNANLGRQLEDFLSHYGEPPASIIHLDDLPCGSLFHTLAKPSITLRSIEHRRTRWLCTDVVTGTRYLVPGIMEVQPE